MRLPHLVVLTTLFLFPSFNASPQTTGPQGPLPAEVKKASEPPPFSDAKNMTVMVFFADPPSQPGMRPVAHANANGSGVWVGNKGYVATCQRVIADWHGPFKIGFARAAYVAEGGVTIAVAASVNLWDAELIASDADSDVALLRAHVSPENSEPLPLATGSPLPEKRVSPKGAALRKTFPAPGESLLLAGYPISQRTLILQIGPATEVDFPEYSPNHVASGLRIFLSLVSNPGNCGGPVLDAQGQVVGLLEANLSSPIRDKEGRQLFSPTVKIDGAGNFVKDTSGRLLYEIIPLQQNSGMSIAVPARSIAELARNNNIDLE